jgi:hypothetical protein
MSVVAVMVINTLIVHACKMKMVKRMNENG